MPRPQFLLLLLSDFYQPKPHDDNQNIDVDGNIADARQRIPTVPPKGPAVYALRRFTGFSGLRSRGTKRPSLRISSPSNQISPPPHSFR